MKSTLFVLFFAGALQAGDDDGWIRKLGGKVESDASGHIIAVNLAGTWVNDTEMLQLVSLAKLERLDLAHTRISDEGLLHLRPARQIRDLNLLYAEQITDLGTSVIKGWTNLRRLNVRGTRISDPTLAIVSKLPQIEFLDIANTGITENGLEYLVPLTRLKHLSIGRSRSSNSALSVIRLLSTLESLDLSGPRGVQRTQRQADSGGMPEDLVKAIAELKGLRVLKLGHSPVGAAELRRLAPLLGNVEKLGLEACQRIDDEALQLLVGWKSLKFVDLQETKVSQAEIDSLRKERPDLVVLSGPFASKT